MVKTTSKEEFVVTCPFCRQESVWSLQLQWRQQKDLHCPECKNNVSRIVLQGALNLQKHRLLNLLYICAALFVGAFLTCLFIVKAYSNEFNRLPAMATFLFSLAAVVLALDASVLIVLINRLRFLRKRLQLLQQ